MTNKRGGRYYSAYWIMICVCFIYAALLYIAAYLFIKWFVKDTSETRKNIEKAFQCVIGFSIINTAVSLIWGYNALKFGYYGHGVSRYQDDFGDIVLNVCICVAHVGLYYYYITVAKKYQGMYSLLM